MADNAPDRPTRPDAIEAPHPTRFDPSHPHFAEAMAAHANAVSARSAGYLDPGTGLFVMTARYLLERGWCCDRGCRHCPWVGAEGQHQATEEHR